jgi:acyl carrier protein
VAEETKTDSQPETAAGRLPVEDVNALVVQTVRELVQELHPNLVDPRLVRLESDLDRDLALDSLSRAELLLRLSRAFRVHLPEELIGEADRPSDLVAAILAAGPPRRAPGSGKACVHGTDVRSSP